MEYKILIAIFIITIVIHGGARYLYHNRSTLQTVEYEFAKGYGHELVNYFDKINVLVIQRSLSIADLGLSYCPVWRSMYWQSTGE